MIETQDAWNARLRYCECCLMPVCPEPLTIGESIQAKYGANAIGFEDGVFYGKITVDYWWTDSEGTFHPEDPFTGEVRNWNLLSGPCGETDVDSLERDGVEMPPADGIIGGNSESYDLEQPFVSENYMEAIMDHFNTNYNFVSVVCGFSDSKIARFSGPMSPSIEADFIRKVRIRFRIPTTHTGSYFKITYDIAEFPEDGDPSFISQDNVIEWTGPGTGGQSDPSWLAGDWVEIEPPEDPGERRIVNIRYTCYAGTKFGVRPQVTGESLEIPPP
jgi:hypothetical protein